MPSDRRNQSRIGWGARYHNVAPVNGSNAVNWESVCLGKSQRCLNITFREFDAIEGQVISNGFCFFVNDTTHRRYGNTKLIRNSAISNPLTEEIRGYCRSKFSYFMIRGRNWLKSFAKDDRESRKCAIYSASHLPSATYHFRTKASIIFSRLSRDFSCIWCIHRRFCVISLAAWYL